MLVLNKTLKSAVIRNIVAHLLDSEPNFLCHLNVIENQVRLRFGGKISLYFQTLMGKTDLVQYNTTRHK